MHVTDAIEIEFLANATSRWVPLKTIGGWFNTTKEVREALAMIKEKHKQVSRAVLGNKISGHCYDAITFGLWSLFCRYLSTERLAHNVLMITQMYTSKILLIACCLSSSRTSSLVVSLL